MDLFKFRTSAIRGICTLSGEATIKIVLPLFWNGVYSKTMLPFEATFHFWEQIPFQKGTGVKRSKKKVTKVASLLKITANLPSVSNPRKMLNLVNVPSQCVWKTSRWVTNNLDPDKMPYSITLSIVVCQSKYNRIGMVTFYEGWTAKKKCLKLHNTLCTLG